MLALKDIPGVAPVLGGTELAKSPIWNKPIDRIHPSQLMAFRARMSMRGQKAQADAALDYMLRHPVKGSIIVMNCSSGACAVLAA